MLESIPFMIGPFMIGFAGLSIGVILGGLIIYGRNTRQLHRAELLAGQYRDTIERLKADITAATEALIVARAESNLTQTELARLRGHQEAEQAAHARQLKELSDLKAKFAASANEALKTNQGHFLELAKNMLENERKLQQAETEKARQATAQQLAPVKETLAEYQKSLKQFQDHSTERLSAVSEQIRQVAQLHHAVRAETANLKNALKSAPKTRGRWGEEQLRNVLELAGMAEHTDFRVEVHTRTASGASLRPDAIIRMPGGRTLIIDAKTSTNAYVQAVEAEDEATRELCLDKHVSEIKTHIRQLSSKAYWQSISDSADMVVMFIPGDNFYAAAIERDPALFQNALDQKVLLATPTTLFAIAKAIAYGWQQDAINRDARRAAELGQQLYARLVTTGNHIQNLGKAISGTVEKYNKFVGSLERRTLPIAREFTRLEGIATPDELPEVALLEETPRPIKPGSDLSLDPDD